ncbi:IS110 family transposase [Lactobacillus sp. LL6]|uniref:IS110 family transposase n=1 Tax=Lactobacillus sp. LL6 TaxID=2596827 RepID=UPI0011862C39|nr:IS110 family transposase [Lactobacillus sp. LL6]TSO25334.1 IS110 family transposase [Lactobacillus sp. LL6]TSO25485.1 IS110 family transposase [Lactobacillus sp. LL6]TSO26763.1 IS110 family transposase [Lactobacillus sp. LL6]TSO26854.1 IS110 family transposase [Lactobacillus sp. LL6]
MDIVFGIDVSSRESSICMLMDDTRKEFKISNDSFGFKELLKNLAVFSKHPQIIFEATGVYSRRLQKFLEDYGYDYVILNPLKAKKEMDQGLRHNKTDKTDAYNLARIQLQNRHKANKQEAEDYHRLRALSRSYEELTSDIVSAKNRLHRILQLTFPEIETVVSTPKNRNYWELVKLFPHCQTVREIEAEDIINKIKDFKGYGIKRAQKIAQGLKELANKAYPVAELDSPETSDVIYYAQRLIQLDQDRDERLKQMVDISKKLPNRDLEILTSIPGFAQTTAVRVLAELGDIRRFDNPNKIDAFIGIDPGRYQSGQMDSRLGITKHGNAIARKILYRAVGQIDNASKTNPCHIADYYENKKSSQSKGFKKIAIASVHKLIRTIYALIKNDQLYSYEVAKQNQRRKS